jgi:hypothetical protein
LIKDFSKIGATVAQPVEQGTENPCVGGSIPSRGTIYKIYSRKMIYELKIFLKQNLPKSIIKLLFGLYKGIYIIGFKIILFIDDWKKKRKGKKEKNSITTNKYLYASAVGKTGKNLLAKIINKFGHECFDYLIFVYDDAKFDEEIFRKCQFIYEKGIFYYYFKKYLTPVYCKKYDFIFVWTDDIDVEDFSYENFIEIMKRNNLEMAQASLSHKSYCNIKMTLKNKQYKIGRYVDYVEVMATVFTREAWIKCWHVVEEDWNFWGWGYNILARSLWGCKRMGIVDCETVTHTRPPYSPTTSAPEELRKFLKKHKRYRTSLMATYGALK